MIRGTGWDEIVLGLALVVGGVLYLLFREYPERSGTRFYARWIEAFPGLAKTYPFRFAKGEANRRSVVTLAGVVLIVVGLGLVVWGAVWGDQLTPKTWIVQLEEPLRVRAELLHHEDRWRCRGSDESIPTPPVGHTAVNMPPGLTVHVHEDGSVTATCEPVPPGNA